MAFCFPGQRPDGSDLPPRRECAETWRGPLLARLPRLRLLLAVGGHAQRWHLGPAAARRGVTATVRDWRSPAGTDAGLRIVPLPHPSWHNNRWLGQNPWFDAELLPALRAEIATLLASGPPPEIRGQPRPRPTLSAETTAEGSER